MLFVAGDAPRSRRARANLAAALNGMRERAPAVTEVDILLEPSKALEYEVFATPALMRVNERGAIHLIYGDLSDRQKVDTFMAALHAMQSASS